MQLRLVPSASPLVLVGAALVACATGAALDPAASSDPAPDAAVESTLPPAAFDPTRDAAAAADAPDDARGGDDARAGVDARADVGPACVPPVTGTCDTRPQCGCTTGQNCVVRDPSGATECRTAGTRAAFQSCTRLEDCVVGLMCLGNACEPYCDTNADCTAPRTCQGARTTTGPIPGLKTCH